MLMLYLKFYRTCSFLFSASISVELGFTSNNVGRQRDYETPEVIVKEYFMILCIIPGNSRYSAWYYDLEIFMLSSN